MYSIVVWHNNDLAGKHQQVLTTTKTLGKCLRDYAKIMTLPESMRSFKPNALTQLYGPDGLMFNIV